MNYTERAQIDTARSKVKSQMQASLPKNPATSCTVSKGIWYDAKKIRYRASIGSYRSKWFWTQDGAEKHRQQKLDEAKLEELNHKIEALERERCEVLKRL